jgi:diacylglycerol kinase (ATP)
MTNTIGVISNARSRRNRTSLHELIALLHDHPQVKHHALHEVSEIPESLREMAAEGVTHLVISGGDGSVQAVISELINASPFAEPPKLSLLPAGMTNVIALDMGITDKPVPYLKRLIERVEAGQDGERLDRPVLSLDLNDGGPSIHGFLLGAIAFYQGTILGRDRVHSLGFQQSLGSKLGLVLSALKVLWYGPGEKSGFTGERVTPIIDGKPGKTEELFLVVATTLSQILPGVAPFWGEGEGRMRLTTISHPPKRFARAFLPAIKGRPRPWMESHGYCSRRAEQLEIDLTSPVVFDGEFLETDGGPGLKLSVGPTLAFHRF